ncbi:MAG: peptidase [Deltaproteobacteria bacterium]|nr:peptidase [Deltaproteobacteria bacterium]
MRLYAGSSGQFVEDTVLNQIAGKLKNAFFSHFRYNPPHAEINSWQNSLIRRTANVLWEGNESFDFKILDSPQALEEAIRKKAAEGYTARMMADFCWKWSDPRPDGALEEDVVIGEYRRPWNARPEATRLAKGIPKASLWAHLPGGIDQVGCIYTAQGFEFDYAGVIYGRDLLYRFDRQDWVGDNQRSYDTVVKRSGRMDLNRSETA